MKEFIIEIELECVEVRVQAKNRTEARQKAIKKLNRKKPASYIEKDYRSNRKKIWIDEIS